MYPVAPPSVRYRYYTHLGPPRPTTQRGRNDGSDWLAGDLCPEVMLHTENHAFVISDTVDEQR